MNLTFKLDQYFIYNSNLTNLKKKYKHCKKNGVDVFTSGWWLCKKLETRDQLKSEIVKNKDLIKSYQKEIDNLKDNPDIFNGVTFISFKDCIEVESYFSEFPHSFIGKIFQQIHYLLANYIFCCFYSEATKRKLAKTTNLLVERSPEPTDVIWENLQYSENSRFCRKMLVYLISFVLIGISFGIILALNYFQWYAQTEGWVTSIQVKYTISCIISFTISIINYFISTTMNKITVIEKNVSITEHYLSLSIKLCLVRNNF